MSVPMIMTDIETLSQSYRASILSIGAVKFGNGNTYDEFYEVVSIQSCIDVGLVVDEATIAWWMSQSKEARDVLKQSRTRGKPLKHVLESFNDFMVTDKVQFWAHGIVFDIGILERAYEAAGVPWRVHWNNYMDTRTIFNLYPKDQQLTREGTYHNALDDAKHQARNLMHILEI